MEQLGLFPDPAWTKRYRAVVARATANSLGIAKEPTPAQLWATRRVVRVAWWTRMTGGERGRRDIAADERLKAADEILLRAGFRHYARVHGIELPAVAPATRGHGGWRDFDSSLSESERLQKKCARQQALRLERIAKGLCSACGRPKDREGKTCVACLGTDRDWRKSRAIREKTAQYLDEECQPLLLTGPTRMVPVKGDRKDCRLEDDCLDELIRACGRQDPQGASCPKDCPSFQPRDRREQLELYALGRTGAGSD
jgi:hypothetical protein